MSLEPKNPEIKNNYAVFLCQQQAVRARRESWRSKRPPNPLYKTPEVGLLNAGNCARGAGDMKAAEEYYPAGARGAGRASATRCCRWPTSSISQTDYMSARAFLERYLEVGRTNPATLWLGVRIERGLGNKAQAQHYAQRLKNEYPSAAQTKELLESERNPG